MKPDPTRSKEQSLEYPDLVWKRVIDVHPDCRPELRSAWGGYGSGRLQVTVQQFSDGWAFQFDIGLPHRVQQEAGQLDTVEVAKSLANNLWKQALAKGEPKTQPITSEKKLDAYKTLLLSIATSAERPLAIRIFKWFDRLGDLPTDIVIDRCVTDYMDCDLIFRMQRAGITIGDEE